MRCSSWRLANTSAPSSAPRQWTWPDCARSLHAQPVSRRSLAAHARRGGSSEDDRKGGGFRFEKKRGSYRLQYNDYKAEVREDEAWKLVVPVLGSLVFGAAVIGPLIIGVAFSAVAVGAALSAGALFTSLFLPFFLLIGMGALFFGGLTFSAFATLGTALLLPKMIALAVAAGGLGLGAMAVSLFLRPAAEKAKASYRDRDDDEEEEDSRAAKKGGRAARKGREGDNGGGEVVAAEFEEVADPEVERQLKDFDALLAERERERRRSRR